MALDEFDCVVLGDEPAGLWLAKRLSEHGRDAFGVPLAPLPAVGKAKPVEPPRPLKVAWISLGGPFSPHPVPTFLAKNFGLQVGPSFHAEIVTPRHSLLWERAALESRFGKLPFPKEEENAMRLLARPPAALLAKLRLAIATRPELLDYSIGLLKRLGRAEQLHPEFAVLEALCCAELAWWEPAAQIPDTVQRYEMTLPNLKGEGSGIEKVKSTQGSRLTLQWKDLPPISSRHWILNLSYHQYDRMSAHHEEWLNKIPVDPSIRSSVSLYPLTLTVEPEGIPCPVRPLTCYLDSEEIPDPGEEMWPFELEIRANEKELKLWVSAPTEASLEEVNQRFRAGLQRMNRLFPFLPRTLKQIRPAIDLESCHAPEVRERALEVLESSRRERFRLTSLRTDTRSPSIRTLFPSLRSHLPYPFGTLSAALPLSVDIIGRKALKMARVRQQKAPQEPRIQP